MFSGRILSLGSKKTELESNNQEASSSAGKDTELALLPCCTWKSVPTAIFGIVDISEVPGSHLLQQVNSQ